jgi:hypothetical protein
MMLRSAPATIAASQINGQCQERHGGNIAHVIARSAGCQPAFLTLLWP